MIGALRGPLERIGKHDRDLEDQVRRAASSVALNISEGNRRQKKDRIQRWRIAAGSAAEVRSGLRIAGAWGYVEPEAVGVADGLADRVLAMLWRLTH